MVELYKAKFDTKGTGRAIRWFFVKCDPVVFSVVSSYAGMKKKVKIEEDTDAVRSELVGLQQEITGINGEIADEVKKEMAKFNVNNGPQNVAYGLHGLSYAGAVGSGFSRDTGTVILGDIRNFRA